MNRKRLFWGCLVTFFLPLALLAQADDVVRKEPSRTEGLLYSLLPILIIGTIIWFVVRHAARGQRTIVTRHQQHMERVEQSLERIAQALEKKNTDGGQHL